MINHHQKAMELLPIGEGLIKGIYPKDKMEEKEQLLIFGIDTQKELDEEIDLMSKEEDFVCKHSREDAIFNLLDVPSEITKRHVLSAILESERWDEKSNTLEDSNNILIIIKNVREITPQQATIFKLAESF